jgi:glycosyltransferase A (GT-A) superfamily protein (DUF2064 family)
VKRRSGSVAVAIMARTPEAGAVKTRLCPPLAPRVAALARCFLRDRIAGREREVGSQPFEGITVGRVRDHRVCASGDLDVVLGPTEDGGYYLTGIRADQPTLFENVPWSTSDVLALTLRRADAAGLRCALLSPWFDVDTPGDRDRLRAALADELAAAPATHRFFVGHDARPRR